MIIWLTGLPCSGKTTLALKLAEIIKAEILDGDDLRNSPFSKDAGFTHEDRKKHLLRVGYMAQRLSKYTNVICSFVVPHEDIRQELPSDIWIYVKCSPEICSKRDVKGMWKKAKEGLIKNFTGFDAPFEEPQNPHIIVDTEKLSIEECIKIIIDKYSKLNKEN